MTDPIDPITLQSIPKRRRVRLPNASIEGSSIWNAQSLASMLRRGNDRHPMTRIPLDAITQELIYRHADDIELTFRTPSGPPVLTYVAPRSMKMRELVDVFKQRVHGPYYVYPDGMWVANRQIIEDFSKPIKSYFPSGARSGVIHIVIRSLGGPSRTFARRAWTRGNDERLRQHGSGTLHPNWLTKPGGPYHR